MADYKPFDLSIHYLTILTPPETTKPFNLTARFDPDYAPLNTLNILIDTSIRSFITGSNASPSVSEGYLFAIINTAIIPQITGTNWESVDNRGTLLGHLDTSINSNLTGTNDINFIRGIETYCVAGYQRAISCLTAPDIPWTKPVLRVSNEALFYDQGLVISNQADIRYEQAGSLTRAVGSLHEQATGLSSDAYIIWEEGDKRFIHQRYRHQETIRLRHNRETVWQEMIRRRKTFTYSHEVAHVFEKCFAFEWDKGLELITTSSIAWDKAKAIHYRKHPVQPWPQPEIPEYVGRTDLNFNCLCTGPDPHNLILNFGADDCIPGLPPKNWWYIVNELSVSRLDNGQNILVYDGSYSTDRSRWCWSYSLSVPATEIPKLEPVNGQPVILKIMANGTEHHMLLENRSRSRR
ncbi:hypothetical protein NVV26_14580, partial [Acinetobacter radioresistens]|nr:hypothetical protein [Acinetobacter radioresistens]